MEIEDDLIVSFEFDCNRCGEHNTFPIEEDFEPPPVLELKCGACGFTIVVAKATPPREQLH